MKPHIVTLTGPSCAGKSTLEKELKRRGFSAVISTTTRAPRTGEIDGESYYFVDRETFERDSKDGKFVETAEFNGQLYGVSSQEIERVASLGRPIVVIVEPQGLLQMVDYAEHHGWVLVSVFINNSLGVIGQRFLERFATDLVMAIGKEGHATNVVATYKKRIAHLLEEELLWESEMDYFSIDYWVETFDESNFLEVADEVEAQLRLAVEQAVEID